MVIEKQVDFMRNDPMVEIRENHLCIFDSMNGMEFCVYRCLFGFISAPCIFSRGASQKRQK